MPVVGMDADPRAEEFRGKDGPHCADRCSTCFEGIDNAATGIRNLAVEPGAAIRPFAPKTEPEALYQPAADVQCVSAARPPRSLEAE